MATSEPSPLLKGATEHMHSGAENRSAARRRRKSSILGSDLMVGDTGAPSLATSIAHLNSAHHHNGSTGGSSSSGSSGSSSGGGGGGGGGGGNSKDGTTKRGSRRRKTRSYARKVKQFAMRHTWVLPLVILVVFLSLYAANPTASNPVHRFIFLSYRLPAEAGFQDPRSPYAALAAPQYGKGLWDVALVSFYIVVLSFTREFIMQELLRPLARHAGIRSRGKQARFMEQMYTAVYFSVLGPAGMYVMSRTPVWYFNTRGMYENFPHKTHDAYFKFYYLFQAAYWAQQAIVLILGMEKPRKDFKELVGHHVVSLALIALSYRFHFTYMGLAVYITHDISDFFLATSKSLNYVDHWLMGPYFTAFIAIWIYLRHYINLRIIWSLLTEFRTVGPYELNWETGQYKCLLSQVITFSLLAALQALNLFWLFFIIRIAYRFALHSRAEDDRSDNEETEAEEQSPDAGLERNGHAAVSAANGNLNGNLNGNENVKAHGKAISANGSSPSGSFSSSPLRRRK